MDRSSRAGGTAAHGMLRLVRWASQLLRDVGPHPSPLCRRSDRLEAWARLAALALWVAAIPLAIWTGSVVHHGLDARAAALTSSPAVVMSEPADPDTRDGWVPRTAKVAWTTATGVRHTAVARIPWNATRGTRFTLWTDAAGRPTMPPPAAAIRWADGFIAALGVLLAAFALVGLALLGLRQVLDRSRYREWDVEWLQVGASRPRRGDGLR